MKHLTVQIMFLFLATVAEAQKDNAVQTLLKSKCEHVYLSLNAKQNKNKLKNTLPFRNFEVVDYRSDSSRIGLFFYKDQQYDMLFKSTASSIIGSFLNQDYANPSASSSLYVVIKELWFSDVAFERPLGERASHFKSRIRFKAETYIKDNTGYIPLAIFDTLITSPKVIMDIAYFRLQIIMSSFIERINALNTDPVSIKKRRLLSYAFVDSFSNRDFLYPIDTANTLRTGVYANFEEFRNNKPSIFNYAIEKEENSLKTIHLKDEKGETFYSRKMWGFCDGLHIYVMMDGKLFPILSYNRAYYVYGPKEYLVKKNNAALFFLFPVPSVLGAFPSSEKVITKLRFFKLDQESGEIY